MKYLYTFFLVSFLAFGTVQASEQDDVVRYCAALSTWAHVVIMQKVRGVPQEQALQNLEEQQEVPPQHRRRLASIITAIYEVDLPIQSAADVAAIVTAFNKTCIEQVTIEMIRRNQND